MISTPLLSAMRSMFERMGMVFFFSTTPWILCNPFRNFLFFYCQFHQGRLLSTTSKFYQNPS